MRDHYEPEDRKRLSAKESAVLSAMLDRGWMTLDKVASQTGIQQGTVSSRLRDLKARHDGVTYERRRVKEGLHEYRVYSVEPGQMPLFDQAEAVR